MKARILLLAAAAVAQLTTPAHAVPGCFTYSPHAPVRDARPGQDLVKAEFDFTDSCAQEFSIGLFLDTKVCGFWGCEWRQISYFQDTASPTEKDTVIVQAACREGTHRYGMRYEIRDTSFNLLAWGGTAQPELTCSDSVPASPDIECPKYAETLCKDIDPGR